MIHRSSSSGVVALVVVALGVVALGIVALGVVTIGSIGCISAADGMMALGEECDPVLDAAFRAVVDAVKRSLSAGAADCAFAGEAPATKAVQVRTASSRFW